MNMDSPQKTPAAGIFITVTLVPSLSRRTHSRVEIPYLELITEANVDQI